MRQSRVNKVLVVFAFLSITACATARERAISTTFHVLNASRDAFDTYDKVHQNDIVKNATSYAQGEAELQAWWKTQSEVRQAFLVAYTALAAATLDPGSQMVIEAAKAAKDVYDLVKGLQAKSQATPAPTPTPASPSPAK
jgi:hypothetical protein